MRWRCGWVMLAFVLFGCHPSGRDSSLRFRFRYDKENRLVETVSPDGSSTNYYYDKPGRLVTVRYAKGRTDYGYGDDGLLWTKDAEGSTEFFRDNLGRVVDMLWRRSGDKVVHLDLDPWGGLTGVSVYRLAPAPSALADTVKVLRGPLSNLANVREKRRQALQRFLAEARAAGGSLLEYSVRYDRDIFGRLTAMDSRAGRVTFVYRDDVREAERRLPNGIRTVWRYTAGGQLESLAHYDPSGREAASWTYFYDAAGLLTKVSEVMAGQPSEKQLRRDPSGILREVSAGGGPVEAWQYDQYGRPIRQGQASLEWNKAGQLAARAANGRRVQFEYDGRDLPIRASAGRTDYRFRWDTEGRLDSLSTPQGKYALLPDLTGTTAEPWMKWKVDGSAPTAYFSDGSVYAEVDAGGNVRYLLRDGEGKVRFSADGSGRLAIAGGPGRGPLRPGPPGPARGIFQPVAFATPASAGDYQDADYQNDASESARQEAIDTALATAEQAAQLQEPQLRGLLFNTKVQNYVADFLKSTPQTEVDYLFNGINTDWHKAWKDTQDNYKDDKKGLFIPLFASIPKGADAAGTIWEKTALALPFVGRLMQTRKVDLRQIIEQTHAAGKTVNSFTFESGAGFEEQRQVEELLRWADEHPDEKRPKLIYLSTGRDSVNEAKLVKAKFPVEYIGKDPLVTMLVDNGPIQAPLVGGVLSLAYKAGDLAVMTGSAAVTGRWNTLLAGHGYAGHMSEVLAAQDSYRTTPLASAASGGPGDVPLHNPAAYRREQLGGIELGAKASAAADIGTIRGVVYDKVSQRVALLGDHQISADGLDAEDFAVALLMAYHDPPITARFSLDPADPRKPDGKWMKAVYMPQEMLAGTRMGRTMFVTDWLMKQYSFGLSVDSVGHVSQLPALPGGLDDEFAISFRGPFQKEKVSWTRLWIVADDFKIQVHGTALTFATAKMAVRAKRQVVDPSSPTGLRDDERAVDESAREFAARFTANYDKVAEESPEFHRLRELAKAVALANWLRDSGVPVDLDWAHQLASARSPYADKVPTLTNQRDEVTKTKKVGRNETVIYTDTRTVRLTGGVELALKPITMAEAPLAEEISTAAMAPMRSAPAFVVEAGGSELEGEVLPVTGPGREAWTKASTHTVGDATRTLDAGGRPVRMEYRSGRDVVYSYGKNGQLAEARVADPNGQGDLYRFGPSGKIVSGELRGQVKMAARLDADGSLGGLRFTTPDGEQAEVAYGRNAGPETPPGGSRFTVHPGGRAISYDYDAQGNLAGVNAGGTRVASYSVEGQTAGGQTAGGQTAGGQTAGGQAAGGQTVTARSGPYTESVTTSPDGAMRTYRRTAPDLDGKPVTQTVQIPVQTADRALTAPELEGRVNLPSGSTVDVGVESSRGGSTIEIRQYPMTADLVVGRDAVTVDAQGRILKGAKVVGQLGTPSAPVRLIFTDSPERVAELQGKYGTTQFYLGTDTELAKQNLARLPLISNVNEVAVQLPAKEAGVVDFDAIQSIRDVLPNLKVLETGAADEFSKVELLNGHNAPEFRHWVETLGESGGLRGKLLVLNSCTLDAGWNSTLIRESGVVGIYSYTGEIAPQAVKDVTVQFYELLNVPRSHPESLESLWRQAVRRAMDEAPTQWLRQQIELLLKGVMQVSRNSSGRGWEGDLG